MKTIVALIALVLGGCSASHTVQTRLPDGKIVAHVYASGQDLTVAAATISTDECKPKCVHVATGGGVTSGAAGILGPLAGGLAYGLPMAAASRNAQGNGSSTVNTITTSAGAVSRAKSTGAGSSNTTVRVNNANTAIGTGGSAAATNTNTNRAN